MNLTEKQIGIIVELLDKLFTEEYVNLEFASTFGTDELEALWIIRSELMEDF